ncbi:conserved hypothetical protein [Cyanobium sp. PCC 7001]|uniref:hypothetical protein n=1 Tax=Cyanobium sp. PCC 7001 TaxID=180281 RepID=UPI0001805D02|nr:hypothetical protein [Cyanobium sp. PCC 7001]EDY38091.1 conserved hypothetical protein [Cyanobium sp. PCC 7001]
MSFDARSLERLQQLGRTLPKPLPKPEAPPPPARADRPRHKVETETDPEALFRELMQASPDGTVPPHLLDRLRALEAERRQSASIPEPSPAQGDAAAGMAVSPSAPPARRQGLGRANPHLAKEHGDLYTAFQQLLLEDDEEL